MRCDKCGEYFECRPYSTSWEILCPNCCETVSEMSEYGYGMCYPAGFYLGPRKVAELRCEGGFRNETYILHRMGEPDQVLGKMSYPELKKRAHTMVLHWLKGEQHG